jgi:hypothetical protein
MWASPAAHEVSDTHGEGRREGDSPRSLAEARQTRRSADGLTARATHVPTAAALELELAFLEYFLKQAPRKGRAK